MKPCAASSVMPCAEHRGRAEVGERGLDVGGRCSRAIAPRAVVSAGGEEARNGSLVTWLIRLSRLAVACALATRVRRILEQVRQRGAEVVEPIGEVGVAELARGDGGIGDRGGAGDDDVDRDLDGLGHRRGGRAERRRDRRVERAVQRRRGVGRQRDRFGRGLADRQRRPGPAR